MTRDELASTLTPLARHGLTALGAVLAAKGFTGAADATPMLGMGLLTVFGSLAWAWLEKSKLLAGLIENAPKSDIDLVLDAVTGLRAQGASPLVVAHFVQAAATLAAHEIMPVAAKAPVTAPPEPLPTPASPAAPMPIFAPQPGDEVAGDGA